MKPRRTASLAACSTLVALASLAAWAPAQEPAATSEVGMRTRVEQVLLPGSELRARPLTLDAPIVLRVLAAWPHGVAGSESSAGTTTMFRYDLEYVGLEPGSFDLVERLERIDGSPVGELPKLLVRVDAVLPPGQIEPNALLPTALPTLGGYRMAMIALGALWLAGIAALLFVRRRRSAAVAAAAPPRPLTLAERLRPKVEAARAGTLDPAGRAELERLLLSHWRQRAGLDAHRAADAIAALREHPQAGPLVRALEDWLHRPGDRSQVDVAALLDPYRDVTAEPEREVAPR